MRKSSNATRNYAKESEIAESKLVNQMMLHRGNREAGIPKSDIVQMSTTLVLSGLPYRPTDETRITRTVRTARGFERTTFHALGQEPDGTPVPMAYGCDRTFLHWCIDQAIKRRDPFVPMPTTKVFLDSLEVAAGGKGYASLRESVNRLSGLAIVQERGDEKYRTRNVTTIISHARLPRNEKVECILSGPGGIIFGAEFFKEINTRHVPFLWPLLRDLHKKPKMQDYISFLHRRCSDAASESFIPWDRLREQLWQTDSNPRRLRADMKKAIALFKVAWPELNAKAELEGLRIGAPLRGLHFLKYSTPEEKIGL
jgi:hypothetical protein